jgi:hypothetical protein
MPTWEDYALMMFYTCSTVGGTRYLKEWMQAIKKLNPHKIVIARDVSRSEPIGVNVEVLEYDTRTPWQSYESRHTRWESDVSILEGMKILVKHFLACNLTHFIHVDSDVILSDMAVYQIRQKKWDYLQIGVPTIPRELSPTEDWRKHIGTFFESTNFGLSRRLAEKIVDQLAEKIVNPYPVDINIHKIIKENYSTLQNPVHHNICNAKILHYIKGERVMG